MRHVRAVAVFGIAVLALTGARGSGGGCSGNSSSDSGSGSHSDSDYDSDSGSNGDSSSSGGSTGEAGNISERLPAAADIRIEDCVFKEAELQAVAELKITNSDSKAFDYRFTVDFKDPSGAVQVTGSESNLVVQPGEEKIVEVSTSYYDPDNEAPIELCTVVEPTKFQTRF